MLTGGCTHRVLLSCPQHASSSSGGESSCEEGRARRPPHLRPFHPRTMVLDPDRSAPGLSGDPDYSSSSEQSCDTVIYVGPGGTALSDRELTDNEGPPDFVPIIPALSRRRPSEGPRDADHFRCSTFAELQERLECIDGSEGVPSSKGGSDRPQASPARGGRNPSLPEATSPRKAVAPTVVTSCPRGSPGQDTHRGASEPSKTGMQGDQRVDGTRPEPPPPDKTTGGGGRKPLPSPGPPPPRQPEARGVPTEPGGEGADGVLRTPPVGMSGQAARGRHLERGLLTTTVTLQQPVELNGEDELVFTVVEELPLGGLAGATRPSSLASMSSDCSLQALASGSRPVSIISSINDEFDAYTSQVSEGPGDSGELPEGAMWAGGSPASSIGSWLSDVGVCLSESHGPMPQPPFSPDSAAGPGPPEFPTPNSSLEESKVRASECGRPDNPSSVRSPHPGEAVTTPTQLGREPWARSPHEAASAQTLHSSLPRKPRTTSTASRARPSRGPYSPGSLFEDPWLLRAEDCDARQIASTSPTPGSPRLPETQIMLVCGQRVVDGCEVASRISRRPEAVARIPPLRRGATTLGVTTPASSCGDAPAEAVVHSGSLKTTSGSKKSVSPKGAFFPRPSGAGPPAPPVRKSSLEQSTALAPTQALGLTRAGTTSAFRGEEEVRPSGRSDSSVPKATSSLKARAGKMEVTHRPSGHMSLERCEGLTHGSSKVRDVSGRPPRAVPRLGVPPASPPLGPAPASRSSPAKGVGATKPPAGGAKGRNLGPSTSRALGAPVKPLAPVAGKTAGGSVPGPRTVPRAVPGIGAKAGRGTIMGTKQAFRAAHSRVHELAASGSPGRGGLSWGSTDSDSGNDSGVNLAEERQPASPALPSPYSKVTAPRRPQRYSSGHGSDNSSVLSGELPPAMGRTALFYHSGGSSGYESMIRDSEATGSASSAPDSMSESGTASPGARSRSLKSPKKRATGE